MASRVAARWSLVLGVAAVTVVLDQLTKMWALTALADEHVIPVAWTLQFQLHRNTGAAFSMGMDSALTRFLPLLVLVAVGLVVWRTRTTLSRAGAIATGLIIGGAIGNIVDRSLRTNGGGFLSGGVVDFIDLQWWPVFNVADMGVVVGGILFALVAIGGSGAEADGDGPDAPTGAGADVPGAADSDAAGSGAAESGRTVTGGASGPGVGGDGPINRLADADTSA
jgi:signal peptidase II